MQVGQRELLFGRRVTKRKWYCRISKWCEVPSLSKKLCLLSERWEYINFLRHYRFFSILIVILILIPIQFWNYIETGDLSSRWHSLSIHMYLLHSAVCTWFLSYLLNKLWNFTKVLVIIKLINNKLYTVYRSRINTLHLSNPLTIFY